MGEGAVEYRPEGNQQPSSEAQKIWSHHEQAEKSIAASQDESSDDSASSLHDTPYEPQVNARVWIVTVLLAMVWGLPAYATVILQAISTSLAEELDQPSLGVWFVSAATLPIAVLNLVIGTQTDLFGRRWFILIGAAIATIGFVILSTTTDAYTIIAGTCLVGAGGGIAQVANIAAVELLPNKWRHIAIMLADTVIFTDTIVGPVTARYGLAYGTWAWNFRALAIIEGLTCIGLAVLYFPPPKPRGFSRRKIIWQLDYVGMVLFLLGSVLLLVGLIYAGVLPSSSPKVVATLISGFGMLAVYALWETFSKTEFPLTPPKIFSAGRGRDATAPLIAIFFLNFVYFGAAIIWPQMINKLYTTKGPAKVTWRSSAELNTVQGWGFAAGGVLQSIVGGYIRRWRWQLVIGMTFTTIFGALLALADTDNKSTIIAMLFLSQLGYGYTFIVNNTICQFGVKHKNLGLIGGLINTARHGGGSISGAIYQTILLDAVSRKTKAGSSSIEAYKYGFKTVALVSIAFGAVAIIASLCCKDIDDKMDDKIEVGLKKPTEALHHQA